MMILWLNTLLKEWDRQTETERQTDTEIPQNSTENQLKSNDQKREFSQEKPTFSLNISLKNELKLSNLYCT